jgi:hypothetical protein
MVDGAVLVADGTLIGIDQRELANESRDAARILASRAEII